MTVAEKSRFYNDDIIIYDFFRIHDYAFNEERTDT